MTDNELVAKAKEALEYSYSPYSHFAVGAALLSTDGQVFTGCNIENSSFGATNCAERTAIFKAVSEGVKDFKAIAIVCSGDQPAYPCGICRQVMSEFFNPDTRIIVEEPFSPMDNVSTVRPAMGSYTADDVPILPISFALINPMY